MKKFLAMLLALAMLFSFAACNDSSKEEEENDRKSGSGQQEYNPDDKYGEEIHTDYSEEEYENNSDAHADGEYYIDSATDFVNGHALILLDSESGDTLYYAVTDLNGNITCKTEYSLLTSIVYADTFKTSHGQRILINKNVKDLVCKDINGKVIYTVNDIMASGNGVTIQEPQLNPDGSVILFREISDMYEGVYEQLAYVSADGEIIQDWFDVTVDGTKAGEISLLYYDKGIACLELEEPVYKTVLLNMNDKSVYYDDALQGIDERTDLINGYGYANSCVVSADGVVYNPETSYREDTFYYGASDCVAIGEYDNCIYDVASGELIAQLPINENMRISKCSAFKNGYALIIFNGADNEEYFSLVDINGQFKFEPIKFKKSLKDIYGSEANEIWDGEYILMANSSKNKYIFLDANGQEVSEYAYEKIARDNYGTIVAPGATISDGMVKAEISIESPYRYTFIRYDGSELFPDGRVSLD